MNELIQKKCERIVEAKALFKEAFPWSDGWLSISAALLFLDEEELPSVEKLKETEKVLKEKTSTFSEFRGNIKIYMICKMLLSGEPEKYFEEVSRIYHMLNTSKFFGSEYKVIAAMTICEHNNIEDVDSFVEKTKDLYEKMRKNHPILTSDEDTPFAAMLAATDMDTDTLIVEMEKDYQALKKKFGNSDALQSLTHVMSCSDMSSEARCNKICEIYDELKKEKHKFGQSYPLASLGLFSMIDTSVSEIVNEIIEVDEYLKKIKGFGDLSLGEDIRRMYAAQIVYNAHSEDKNGAGVAFGSVLAYTIAIELCIMVVIVASINN